MFCVRRFLRCKIAVSSAASASSCLARLVVWGHNRHVGDARATAMGEAGEISLGQMMRQRHRARPRWSG